MKLDRLHHRWFVDRDPDARERLARHYLYLCEKRTRAMARPQWGCYYDDMLSVSVEALLKALDSYKGSLGASFETYANNYMTGYLRHYLRNHGPRHRATKEMARRVLAAEKDLVFHLGRDPNESEIAERVGTTSERVKACRRAMYTQVVSLDAPLPGEVYLSDFLVSPDVADNLDTICMRDEITRCLDKLNPRERQLIDMRINQELSYATIAETLGIANLTSIRHIQKAYNKLRYAMDPDMVGMGA